ncbi:MAG: SpoIIE family protein phosphatase [Spirochaetes bacterium]|nr:SpoIIE family protein phosphatase [Spirochaetota bacterium]
MSIRTKIILIITTVIILTALPLSLLFFHRQQQTILKQIINEGFNSAEILSRTSAHILLMNGGKIESAEIDCREMMDILKPFHAKGMVYADSLILSQNKNINGKILAYIKHHSASLPQDYEKKYLPESNLENLISNPFHREIIVDDIHDTFLEMAAITPLPGSTTVIMGRVLYSKNAILSPLISYRNVTLVTLFAIICGMLIVGLTISAFITRPIVHLAKGVERIESGDLSYEVPLLSNDELGKLGNSFNRMARTLALKIAELEEMNKSLARMDAIKDEFLATTSHELKTPINGIIGIAQSLLDGASGELDKSLRQNLEIIVASGKRLAGLVNNILDFSRIKNMDIVLSRKPVELYSLIHIVLAIITPVAQKKRISLLNTIEPGNIFIFGDENRLQQIFLNLLDNAVKFTEQGEIRISSLIKGENVEIQIADTGIGIPFEKQKDIFEPFVQADSSISRRFGGTGLGLAIAKKLVELHGGTIAISSLPHKGTTVTLQLPLCKKHDKTPEQCTETTFINYEQINFPEVTEYISNKQNKETVGKILIVDDDIVNIQVLINHLSLSGYDVRIARSGQQAIELVSSKLYEPDLILLDIMMPVMTGFEVCKIIRETYKPFELPIIMVTARTNSDDIRASFEVGANDYITKPFDKSELLIRVKNAIDLKKATEKHHRFLEIQKDLLIAKEIQKQILPKEIPRISKINIATIYLPMEGIGGDFYDFHLLNDELVGIFVADVVGHGISAAMLAAMIKIAFSVNLEFAHKPNELMRSINNELAKYLGHLFITAHYIVLDLKENKCIFSNAGHWPPLLYRRKENAFLSLHTRGRPLGTGFSTDFHSAILPIARGDRIFIFTDGLIECRNKNGEIFGEDRLRCFLTDTINLSPEDAISSIISSAFQWTGKHELYFDDDVCMLIVDIA